MTGLLHALAQADKLSQSIEGRVLRTQQAVDRLGESLEVLMAKFDAAKQLVADINTETDRIAQKVQDLMDKISASGLSGPQEDELLTDAQAIKDRLSGIGKDPDNPIPPAPTDPVPPPS